MDQSARKNFVAVVAAAFILFLLLLAFLRLDFSDKKTSDEQIELPAETRAEIQTPTFVLSANCTVDGSQLVVSRKDSVESAGLVEIAQEETFVEPRKAEIKRLETSVSVDVDFDTESKAFFVRLGYEFDKGLSWSEVQQIRLDKC